MIYKNVSLFVSIYLLICIGFGSITASTDNYGENVNAYETANNLDSKNEIIIIIT